MSSCLDLLFFRFFVGTWSSDSGTRFLFFVVFVDVSAFFDELVVAFLLFDVLFVFEDTLRFDSKRRLLYHSDIMIFFGYFKFFGYTYSVVVVVAVVVPENLLLLFCYLMHVLVLCSSFLKILFGLTLKEDYCTIRILWFFSDIMFFLDIHTRWWRWRWWCCPRTRSWPVGFFLGRSWGRLWTMRQTRRWTSRFQSAGTSWNVFVASRRWRCHTWGHFRHCLEFLYNPRDSFFPQDLHSGTLLRWRQFD